MFKSMQIINAGEGVKKKESSCTAGGMITATMENSMEVP